MAIAYRQPVKFFLLSSLGVCTQLVRPDSPSEIAAIPRRDDVPVAGTPRLTLCPKKNPSSGRSVKNDEVRTNIVRRLGKST
jgi:hypothetical protein